MKRRNVWITFGFVLLLSLAAGYVSWPKAPNLKIGNFSKSFDLRLGLDLQGGTSLTYTADVSKIPDADRTDALSSVRDVIEQRVNAYGVSEPVVQTNRVGSDYRIIIELAGVKDINEAIKLIGETPLLEFRTAAGLPDDQAKAKAEEVLAKAKQKNADFATLAKEFSDDQGSAVNGGDLDFQKKGVFVPEFDKAIFDDLKVGEITPTPVKTQFGYHLIKKTDQREVDENGTKVAEVRSSHILIFSQESAAQTGNFVPTQLTGKQLQRATVVFNQQTSAPEVQLQFNSEGTKLFADITKENIGKVVAIYLDGQAISLPTVQSEITNGTAVINGSFTIAQAKELVRRLNAGALPVPITLISQQNVGATLGQESIEKSLMAGLIGLALVGVFMLAYYRLPGLIAVVALVIYSAIVLAIFKLWPVTLTLAGIAGYILSIGMAVDANVLVFERTKEELRAGRPLGSAIDEGFKRAWLSIRDSNISSLITCLILIWFGSSLIKGFAITLAIGILVSMFSALTVTRTFMNIVVTQWLAKHPWLFGASQPVSSPPEE